MTKSRTAGWTSESPTPDQLKEFFAQISAKRITKDRLQDFLRGGDGVAVSSANTVTIFVDPATPLDYDKTQDGWKQESDEKFEAGEVSLELVEFLEPGENYINGEELAKRAVKLSANFTQRHAEALLRKSHLIPKEWRGKYVAFPGTVWRHRLGRRYVACLHWRDDRWILSFYWLDGDSWDSHGRLVRLAS